MSQESSSNSLWRQRWWDWWSRRRQASPGEETRTPETERRQSQRHASNLSASCKEISIAGSDAWNGKLRDISEGGIGVLIIQPFPPGTFLGVQLSGEGNRPGAKLLVKVVHASRQKGTSRWLLGCKILREFPSPLPDLPQ